MKKIILSSIIALIILHITGCNQNKSADDFFNSAYHKFELKDLNGALKDYDKAIELNPKFIKAYIQRGELKFLLDDKNGACTDWKKAGDLGNETGYKMAKAVCGGQ